MFYRNLKNLVKSKAWKNQHLLHSVIMPIDKSIMSMGIRRAIASGKFEGREAAAIKGSLRLGDVVLELGSGTGLISSIVAKSGLCKRVVTVEANPQLLPFIKKVHHLNAVAVEVINGLAVGKAETKTGKFYLAKDFSASSMSYPTDGKFEEIVEVPFLEISPLIKTIEPSVLIVDIEGAEVELFSHQVFQTVRAIILEVHQNITGIAAIDSITRNLMQQSFMLNTILSANQILVFENSNIQKPAAT